MGQTFANRMPRLKIKKVPHFRDVFEGLVLSKNHVSREWWPKTSFHGKLPVICFQWIRLS